MEGVSVTPLLHTYSLNLKFKDYGNPYEYVLGRKVSKIS